MDKGPVNVHPHHSGGAPLLGHAQGQVAHVATDVQHLSASEPLRLHRPQPRVLAVGVAVAVVLAVIAVLELVSQLPARLRLLCGRSLGVAAPWHALPLLGAASAGLLAGGVPGALLPGPGPF